MVPYLGQDQWTLDTWCGTPTMSSGSHLVGDEVVQGFLTLSTVWPKMACLGLDHLTLYRRDRWLCCVANQYLWTLLTTIAHYGQDIIVGQFW